MNRRIRLAVVACASTFFSVIAFSAELLIGAGLHAAQGKINADKASILLNLGQFSSFRDEVYWNHIEKRPGQIAISSEATEIDKLIFRSAEKTPILLLLGYGNRLFHGGRQPATAEERAAFANYVTFLARRYADKVYGFEIWNEWNIGAGNPRGSGRYGDPAQYVELVKVVAPIIRREAPNAHISCGSIADKATKWVEDTLTLGLLQHCDSISLHPYVHSEGSKAEPKYAFAWVDEIHQLIRQYNPAAPLPILITELGWPNQTSRHGHPPMRTAAFLAQSLLLAKSRPWIQGIWWYELMDSGGDPTEREHNFGLVRLDLSAKPAFLALRALAPVVGKSQLLGSGVLGSNRHWVRLRLQSGEEVTAVWTSGWKEASYQLTSSDAFASAEVLYGTASLTNSTGLLVEVGELPLVIRHAPGTVNIR